MKFDCNMYIHPTQSRGLTPREQLEYNLFQTITFLKEQNHKCYSQIGNAVPPLVISLHLFSIRKN